MQFPLRIKKLIRGAEAHVKANLGVAADYEANYVELYAPCDGEIETWWGEQGGNWLRITRPNGDKLEFAHLKIYLKKGGHCEEGEKIAITGNTGSVTDFPHLHIQVFVDGQRVDPEKYFEGIELKVEESPKEKIKSDIRQENAFSLLVIADDELQKADVDMLMMETQRGIWQDSQRLVLVPCVSYHKLPVWDNDTVEKICKENFDLKTFQGVAVIYKKGKFREALGQMNPHYKDLGFLINLSYEDPDGDGPYKVATVLEHELLHGFLYLLGLEYAESVHKSPTEFSDDFEQLGRTLEKLFYRRDPEPKAKDNGKNKMDKWYKSSTGSGKLALTIRGLFVALIPAAILFAKFAGVDLSANELNDIAVAAIGVVEAGGLVLSGSLVAYGLGRKVVLKFKKKVE